MSDKVYFVEYGYYPRENDTPIGGKPVKWYLAWARKYESGWGVHRQYLPSSIAELRPNSRFWEIHWGSCTHDGLTEDGALQELMEINGKRLDHGYTVDRSGMAVYEDEMYLDTMEFTIEIGK